jgi:hypothetical protein
MTVTDTTTFQLFMDTVLDNEDDRGYPDDVAFVSEDIENIDEVLKRNLHKDRRPTVLVTGDGVELLIMPYRRGVPFRWIDDLRGQTYVRVGWRVHDHASPYEFRTRDGSRPLADMRRPLAC